MSKLKDLTGDVFGKLTVMEKTTPKISPSGQSRTHWKCLCECGKTVSIYQYSLTSGKSKTCGCSLQQKFRPSGYHSQHRTYLDYQRRRRRNNMDFQLTEDEWLSLTQQDCYYCGASPQNKASDTYGTFIYNGLDRVDNSIGYIKSNVVPCCKNCNLGKRMLTKDEFFSMIKKVYERHLK